MSCLGLPHTQNLCVLVSTDTSLEMVHVTSHKNLSEKQAQVHIFNEWM